MKKNNLDIQKIQRSSQALFQMICEKVDNHLAFLQHVKKELASKEIISRRIGNSKKNIESAFRY